MEWEAPEYIHREKGADWYTVVLIISAGVLIAEIITKNLLLVILTVLATTTFLLLAVRKPRMMHIVLGKKTVQVNDESYPYTTLKAFAVVDSIGEQRLILQSTKALSTYIIVPLEGVDGDAVREFLGAYVQEEDLHEPLSHIIFERLGF